MIKICETKKQLKIFNGMWDWPIQNCGKFLWRHVNAISINNITKIFNFGFVKLSFLNIGKKVTLVKMIKDQTTVFLRCVRKNKNVISIDNTDDVEQVMKNILNISLKCCWRIGQTEQHNCVFE